MYKYDPYHRFWFSHAKMDSCNYDGRSALHLACAEGHLACVKFLTETCGLDPLQKDRSVE